MAVEGVKMKDLAARPRRRVVGSREIGVDVCTAAMVGMESK